jgi:hypothetical protein
VLIPADKVRKRRSESRPRAERSPSRSSLTPADKGHFLRIYPLARHRPVFRDVREVYWFTVRDDRIVNWWDGG